MGRIRSLKPEFPQSESVGRLSRDARLLFLQLWTVVDDYGNGRAAPRLLAGQLYPYDPDAADLIPAWLDELEQQAMVTRYQVDGSSYLAITNWGKHQRVDNAGKRLVPPPAAETEAESASVPHRLAEVRRESPRDSANRREPPQPLEAAKVLAAGLDPDPDPDHEVDPEAAAACGDRPEGADPDGALGGGAPRTPFERVRDALIGTAYRRKLDGLRRLKAIEALAVTLLATGITPEDIQALDRLAASKAKPRDGEPAEPGKLLAHWLDKCSWREVLDEQRDKDRHRDAGRRGKAASSGVRNQPLEQRA